MKQKTENYRDYKDMFDLLTSTVESAKYYAPQSDTLTLFWARLKVYCTQRKTILEILSRELFARLEPGDVVYCTPYDDPPSIEDDHKAIVQEWMPNGNAVRLKDKPGRWSWMHLFIERKENEAR